MRIGPLHLGRLTDDELAALHRSAYGTEVSYPDVGCTLRPGPPGGHGYTLTRTVGQGRDAFEGVVRGLRAWAPQRALGARVHPPEAPIERGTTVLIVLRLGPLEVVAPDRVVACIDKPDAFGFAYGTLAGHPERGEESFVVRLGPDGAVTVTVTVVAEPASRWLALAGPALRLVQRRAVRTYVTALGRAAAASGPGRP
jgi:uncharacterized protein (UPF0548 family)